MKHASFECSQCSRIVAAQRRVTTTEPACEPVRSAGERKPEYRAVGKAEQFNRPLFDSGHTVLAKDFVTHADQEDTAWRTQDRRPLDAGLKRILCDSGECHGWSYVDHRSRQVGG